MEKKCASCGGILIPAELHTDSVGNKQWVIVNNAEHEVKLSTHVTTYICKECGHIEMFADVIEGLK